MKLASLTLTTLFAGFLFTSISLAEDEKVKMPQKGTTNYAVYFTFHRLAELKMEGTGSQWVEEQVGISRNTDGEPFFDQMSVRCVGYVQEVKGDRTLNGACVEIDKGGDQLFTTYGTGISNSKSVKR